VLDDLDAKTLVVGVRPREVAVGEQAAGVVAAHELEFFPVAHGGSVLWNVKPCFQLPGREGGPYFVQPCVALGVLRGAVATRLRVRGRMLVPNLSSEYLVDSKADAISLTDRVQGFWVCFRFGVEAVVCKRIEADLRSGQNKSFVWVKFHLQVALERQALQM
jgi:hypothetical protein